MQDYIKLSENYQKKGTYASQIHSYPVPLPLKQDFLNPENFNEQKKRNRREISSMTHRQPKHLQPQLNRNRTTTRTMIGAFNDAGSSLNVRGGPPEP